MTASVRLWGWDSLPVGLLLLAGSLVAATIFCVNLATAWKSRRWRALRRSWRSVVGLLICPLFALTGGAITWGSFHVQSIRFTVVRLDIDQSGRAPNYYVDDSDGRTHASTRAVFEQLRVGDTVVCQATNAPLAGYTLNSCRQAP
jgi:hypothetical protein